MKYTKGPWKISLDESFIYLTSASILDASGNIIIGGEEDGMMTPFDDCKRKKEETVANIKLIAAAPELLEALQVCWASLQTYGSHPLIKQQVQAAITKATT